MEILLIFISGSSIIFRVQVNFLNKANHFLFLGSILVFGVFEVSLRHGLNFGYSFATVDELVGHVSDDALLLLQVNASRNHFTL